MAFYITTKNETLPEYYEKKLSRTRGKFQNVPLTRGSLRLI